jgi:AcrR family transcriptional regulator
MTTARTRATPNSAVSKDRIVGAAIAALVEIGLTDWTVDQAAKRAECAKGLIIYHFQSKVRLLQVVAAQVRDERTARLAASIERSGADALDDLWEALADEVRSGRFALWLALLADRQVAHSAIIDTSTRQHLITSIASAIGFTAETVELQQVPTFLDGIQIQLLMGTTAPEALREQYDGFWLQLLNAPEAG